MGDRRGAYTILVGKLEGKSPLGRPRCRSEVIIKRIYREWDEDLGTGFLWLRIGAGGGML